MYWIIAYFYILDIIYIKDKISVTLLHADANHANWDFLNIFLSRRIARAAHAHTHSRALQHYFMPVITWLAINQNPRTSTVFCGSVKWLTISSDNWYCQFKINKMSLPLMQINGRCEVPFCFGCICLKCYIICVH